MTNEKEWIKEEFECRYFSDDLTDFERWLIKKARQEERERIIKVIEKLRNKQEDMRYAYSSDSWEHGISTGVHLALEEIKSPSGDLLRSGVEK